MWCKSSGESKAWKPAVVNSTDTCLLQSGRYLGAQATTACSWVSVPVGTTRTALSHCWYDMCTCPLAAAAVSSCCPLAVCLQAARCQIT